ncbi:MAG TPA: phosphodiester glycosidase family protein [Vicinamibacterales bacterium]|nr:phosphodiester glycosidase family protein [Vicinamibacterales bacterium]
MTRPAAAFLLVCLIGGTSSAAEVVDHPFLGVTHLTRTETLPRTVTIHIVRIDLTIVGIRFRLTPPGGTRETVRQTTLDYLSAQQAQVAINSHFFLPFPSADLNAMLIGIAASEGNVFSAFEAPVQSYAIVTDAPGINVDASNQASIVHRSAAFADGTHVVEPVVLWNTVAGSAQIVTNGLKSIPLYIDATHPDGLLTPPGPANYSNSNSWYNLINARTAIGLSQDNQTLVLFTVDRAGGSLGLSVGEVADILINDYGVYNALNLDGGGSTTLAMEHPITHVRSIVNVSSDNPNGRAVASSLAVFAPADTIAPSTVADVTPEPPATHWNNSTVTVRLNATDNPGGAVRDLHYAFTGAHSEPAGIVSGGALTRSIGEEGSTTVTFFASDFVGNAESPQTRTVNIDRTRPVIAGLPAADCALWPPDGAWRHVATVSAVDGLSGLASDSFQLHIESSEPTDAESGDAIRVVASGPDTRELWLRAKRDGSSRGRRYSITASAADLAGNITTATAACVVPHDRRK